MTAVEIQTLINSAKTTPGDLVTWVELKAILEGLKNQDGEEGDYDLDMLGDVEITAPLMDTHVLRWNGTNWENQSLSTDDIAEGDNLFFTVDRVRGSFSAGSGISYNSATGVISGTVIQYTDAFARAAISLTTNGSGAATYNATTGVLNVPTPSSVNLYNSDGTLTGNRTVTLGTNTLVFTSVNASVQFTSAGTTTQIQGKNISFAGGNATINDLELVSYENYRIGTVPGNKYLDLITGSTSRIRIFGNGNVSVSSTVDAGFRLDVSGMARVQGDLIQSTGKFELGKSGGTNTIGSTSAVSYTTISSSSFGGGSVLAITGENSFVNESRAQLFISNNAASPTHRFGIGVRTDGVAHLEAATFLALNANTGKNIGIGTAIDAGFRLDVLGTGRFSGNVTLSSAATLTLNNSDNSVGVRQLHGTTPTRGAQYIFQWAGGNVFGFNSTGVNFIHATTNNDILFINRSLLSNGTSSGTAFEFMDGGRFSPTTGNNTFNIIGIRTRINATGGTNIIRGFFYNPIIESETGTTQRAIETVVGDVLLGTTSGNVGIGLTNPSDKFHVVGTGRITGNTIFSLGASTMIIGNNGDSTYKLSVDGDIRVYGKIRTDTPTGGTGSGVWKLGGTLTGTFTVDTAICIEVEVNGTTRKIATFI